MSHILASFLRVGVLAAVLIATVFRERFNNTRWYWYLTGTAFLLGVVVEIISYLQQRKRDREETHRIAGHARFTEGHYYFQAGIRDNSAALLEQAIAILHAALGHLCKLPAERFRIVSAYTAIGLASEKMAHLNAKAAIVAERRGATIYLRRENGTDRISISPGGREREIVSTDVLDHAAWCQAREAYESAYALLISTHAKDGEEVRELISSARAAGYFFACDAMRANPAAWDLAHKCLTIGIESSRAAKANDRIRDLQGKLDVVEIMSELKFHNVVYQPDRSAVQALLNSGFAGVPADASISAKVDYWSKRLLGTAYSTETLCGSESQNEFLSVSAEAFDCATYCDFVYAAAYSKSIEQFLVNLKKIRYCGEVTWTNRNHYIYDWIRNGVAQGLFESRRFSDELIDISKDLSIVRGIEARGLLVPYYRYAPDADWLNSIRTGDFIAFGSERHELDVFHCGLIVQSEDRISLRHSARSEGGVVEEPLCDFMNRNTSCGVLLCSPTT